MESDISSFCHKCCTYVWRVTERCYIFVPRQHAISCDVSERWQHTYRLCDTGITLQEYNLARQDNQLQFICRPCEEHYWSVASEAEQEHLPDTIKYNEHIQILDS